ncbi:hypothetical protein [Nocardioides sp. Root140]|uniref:hypothetical protein n=1 Tax=Nocardioides sp. Root140 TaxID=1736460 RepID=UPI0006FA155E|nr:hypothetical protein [Nocardioides sp. Root140]KQY62408.1 hypothetical protein ASD30_23835 [Nocardioides sp. Root140]
MERWDKVGRIAAYGAAAAMTPYLVIKVCWVVGSMIGLAPGGDGYSTAGWALLNTVTIGMAAVGIALALALVRPWGNRVPGRAVIFCAWTGAGFLVSILPYAVLSTVIGAADGSSSGSDDEGAASPGWIDALLQFSFLGMGLGLAIALPAYLRRRWPEPFVGPAQVVPGAWWPIGAAFGVGVAWLYWAFGGTVGIEHPDERELNGALLNGLSGLWAVAGAAALWMLVRGRPTRVPHQLLLGIAWLGSGSLFAWSAWKLPLTLVVELAQPADVTPPEIFAVAATLHLVAVVAGAGMLVVLLRSFRRTAPAGPGTAVSPSGDPIASVDPE